MTINNIENARAAENLRALKVQFIRDFKEAYIKHHKYLLLSVYYSKGGNTELAESHDKLADKWSQRLSYIRDILAYTFDMSSDEFRPIAKDAWKVIICEQEGFK